MRYTDRDAEIVKWLGLVGGAGVTHVMEQFGMNKVPTYRRLSKLTEHCLLDHGMVLHKRPGLYWATRQGLRWQGLAGMRVFDVNPLSYQHTWAATTAAVALHSRLPGWRLIYERELRRLEIDERRLIASAATGESAVRQTRHRPDFALVSPAGRVVAVEIELSDKRFRPLCEICRAWAWAGHVDHVYYLARPKVALAVTRAMEAVEAQDKITVLDLQDVAGLAERELAREQAQTVVRAQTVVKAQTGQQTQIEEEVL